ncbi:MAG: putative 3-oxoacyl-(Acyl-carrier-protein) synthase [Bryobacterales bacterium]|nr:putative 3-oxoacyl-(Acyl-carrier-protein) synthase [Bryobacterales bacterium]
MSTVITAIEYTLGSESLPQETLEARFGKEAMDKVLKASGIRHRQVAPAGICGSDMAQESAERLLQSTGFNRSRIDLLIFCTQSPDYFLPTTACLLQDKLGLEKGCAAFDLNLGCSQYVYALGVAHSMIASGLAQHALVLTGDTMTRTLSPTDRSVVPLLGDAGSATLLRASHGAGFLGFEFGTDGSGAKHLMIPAGGFREPHSAETSIARTDAEGNTRTRENLYMNGLAVFQFAVRVAPEIVRKLLVKLSLSMEDINLFLFHQANHYMIDYIVRKLKIPPEKTHFHLDDIGNTSGTSMPVVLKEAVRAGKIKPGALVMLVVFGVGLSWAGTVIRWPDDSGGAAA